MTVNKSTFKLSALVYAEPFVSSYTRIQSNTVSFNSSLANSWYGIKDTKITGK